MTYLWTVQAVCVCLQHGPAADAGDGTEDVRHRGVRGDHHGPAGRHVWGRAAQTGGTVAPYITSSTCDLLHSIADRKHYMQLLSLF